MATDGDLVLLTGLSGYIAKHTALAVLEAGYRLRGTARTVEKGREARRLLLAEGHDPARIEIAVANLGSDDGWDAAAEGCRFVLHMASPFPGRTPREKFALVPEAKGGTERVLAAAERAGVSRAVLTSSVAAIYYGHDGRLDPRFTEADWTDVESPTVGAYAVSKTMAERAAWEFAAGSPMELVSINPSLVLGPLLDDEYGTSISIVRLMMAGRMPLVPNIALGIVDVRDVAAAHVRALDVPDAGGRRFIASAGTMSLMEIAREVAEAVPQVRRRLPKATLPDFAVRLAARFSGQAAQAAPELGHRKLPVADAARKTLGVTFRPPAESVARTARDLVERGLVG